MRRLAGLPLVALLVATLVVLAASSNLVSRPRSSHISPPPPPPKQAREWHSPLRILFVGASVTAGVGATTVADQYPSVLAQEIGREVGPVTSTVVAERGATVSTAQTWGLPRDQDLIVVHLATNDFLRGTPPPLYGASLRALLGRLRNESPDAAVACLGVWAGQDDFGRSGLDPAAYDAQVRSACQGVHGTYVPLTRLFERAGLHGPSGYATMAGPHLGFHPDDAGHQRIAAAVFSALNQRYVFKPEGSDHVA